MFNFNEELKEEKKKFRKEQKELYVPGKSPSLINVPAMKYLTVRGHGDPNQENSEYKKAIEKLYAVAYTIKMSKKGTYQIPDYFDFVVPPTRRTMVARWYHWN